MRDNTPLDTEKKYPKSAWQPGQSGNPGGRPKGSRNKLSEQFLAALCADFEIHGDAVLETVRTNDPSTYMRVAASLLPKQTEIGISNDLRHLTDEQLTQRIQDLSVKLGMTT